ncbi:MerR family transcriptional regulator [Massilia cellulosiltytica]|uniref:MerR family transcriptional regulator n=1 Tax=Massilia cellulosiltytica TaxID=2683234 RepID=UPI0039B63946
MEISRDEGSGIIDPGVHSKVKVFIAPTAMQIGELAAATGLTRDTLRFYEKRGLLLSRRLANGYRDYPPEAVQWLCYLRAAQAFGFTLAEIETGLPLLDDPAAAAPLLRDALVRKLEDIDARIAGLSALRADLARELAQPGFGCPVLEEQAAA